MVQQHGVSLWIADSCNCYLDVPELTAFALDHSYLLTAGYPSCIITLPGKDHHLPMVVSLLLVQSHSMANLFLCQLLHDNQAQFYSPVGKLIKEDLFVVGSHQDLVDETVPREGSHGCLAGEEVSEHGVD